MKTDDLQKALNEFSKMYLESDSGDLQTFILGWDAAMCSTGLSDINGNPIKNGDGLIRTGKFAMTGRINPNIKDIPHKPQYVYFKDGAFRICKKRNYKNACTKRWILNGYLIRRYGLKIIK